MRERERKRERNRERKRNRREVNGIDDKKIASKYVSVNGQIKLKIFTH